ncbi:hypothetical protein WBG78_12860 [Chryseolinea sp. T2]|uniref:hypothetical protein n=1 Tax=Chryseolinea sp. T2 TaxID=3129255 RepID=UPI003077177C
MKIIGALAVGMIYQFYYGGGDTYNYHTWGSRIIWEAFFDSPAKWFKLVFGDNTDATGIYNYSTRILFFYDPSSYAVVRVAGFFDLFTFSAYSATAVLFAVFCFIGVWMLFLTFYHGYPDLHRLLATAIFFIPSVFFWGSGLLKDTLTLGCLGIATFTIHRIFIQRKFRFDLFVLLLVALLGLFKIKIYILLVYLPAIIVWVFLENLDSLKSLVLRIMLFPSVITIATVIAYFAMIKASEDNAKYSINSIAKTAQVTAYDIRYLSGKDAGSGYTLGELDGTFGSMIALAPQAINVSLFRPYLWEVNNPLMLLSSLESVVFLVATLRILFRYNLRIFRVFLQPPIFFSLIFSLTFAFAVGVSTYNFGTLVRYKIPLLPFFALSLILITDYSNRERNVGVLELTE